MITSDNSQDHILYIIKTSSSELWGQEEAAYARHQAYTTTTIVSPLVLDFCCIYDMYVVL